MLAAFILAAGAGLSRGALWGYVLTAVLCLYLIGGAVFLLGFSTDNYRWAAWIGLWIFLVPALAMLGVLLSPSSRRWIGRKRHGSIDPN